MCRVPAQLYSTAQLDSTAMAMTAASISTTQPQVVSASRRAPLTPSSVSARQDGSRTTSPDSMAAATRWTSAWEYTVRDLLDEGKILMAGVSNANPEQIRLANEVLGGRLVSVQNQFSPAFRSSEPELNLCDELGIAFLPWSPLGGISRAGELGSAHAPFARIATKYGVSPQRVCLAWMLAKSPVVVPIPGSSRPETIRDSLAATDLELSADEFAELDAA